VSDAWARFQADEARQRRIARRFALAQAVLGVTAVAIAIVALVADRDGVALGAVLGSLVPFGTAGLWYWMSTEAPR
jgi:hypothetical protein